MAQRPPFFFLVCPDSRLVQERLAALVQEHPAAGDYERHVVWGEDGLDDAFWNKLTLQNLLGTQRLLVVRHAHMLAMEHWRALSAALARVACQAWPILCLEGDWDRGAPALNKEFQELPCWNAARERRWVWQSAGLSSQDVARRLQQWAAAESLRLEPAAAQSLQAILPLDASALVNELDKLALAAGEDRRVGPEHVELVQDSTDLDLYAFLKVLQAPGGQNALKMWKKILSSHLSGEAFFFQFLHALLREVRALWQIKHGEPPKLPPFVIEQKQRLAARLSAQALADCLELILLAERGIKSGEHQVDQALELLAAGMAQTFAPRQPPRTRP